MARRMGILSAIALFAGLVALNSALGYSFFNSGMILASLMALTSGYAYALLVGRFNPNWKVAIRLLQGSILLSLAISFHGLQQVLTYQQNLDPSQDPSAVTAAGQTLFFLQAVGMGLALRQPRPKTSLPDDEE